MVAGCGSCGGGKVRGAPLWPLQDQERLLRDKLRQEQKAARALEKVPAHPSDRLVWEPRRLLSACRWQRRVRWLRFGRTSDKSVAHRSL